MTNKVYHRCVRKVCFRSKQSAENAIARMAKRPGFILEVYECRDCWGWHIGHTDKSRAKNS